MRPTLPRAATTAVSACLAQYADAMSFAACVAVYGIAGEGNPIVRAVGPGAALLAKAGIIAALPVVDRLCRARWLMAFAVAAGVVGAAVNLATLARGF